MKLSQRTIQPGFTSWVERSRADVQECRFEGHRGSRVPNQGDGSAGAAFKSLGGLGDSFYLEHLLPVEELLSLEDVAPLWSAVGSTAVHSPE